MRLLPSAALGLGLHGLATPWRTARAAAAVGARTAAALTGAARQFVPPCAAEAARRPVERWSARGSAGLLRVEEAAAGAVRTVVRALTAAVLDQLDLDAVVDRVDVRRVADRVDVDRVADRVDVRRIADRVDVDAVLARIDLAALTEQVLAEIDIGRVVRDTGGGMAEETIDAFRVQSMRADRLVDRVTDRLLRRGGRAAPASDDKSGAAGAPGSDAGSGTGRPP